MILFISVFGEHGGIFFLQCRVYLFYSRLSVKAVRLRANEGGKSAFLRRCIHSGTLSRPIYGDSILSPLQTTTSLSCQSGTRNRKFTDRPCYSTPDRSHTHTHVIKKVFNTPVGFFFNLVFFFSLKDIVYSDYKTQMCLAPFSSTDKLKKKKEISDPASKPTEDTELITATPHPILTTFVPFWGSLIFTCSRHRLLYVHVSVRRKTKHIVCLLFFFFLPRFSFLKKGSEGTSWTEIYGTAGVR